MHLWDQKSQKRKRNERRSQHRNPLKKEYSFDLFTEIDIVEGCVTIFATSTDLIALDLQFWQFFSQQQFFKSNFKYQIGFYSVPELQGPQHMCCVTPALWADNTSLDVQEKRIKILSPFRAPERHRLLWWRNEEEDTQPS